MSIITGTPDPDELFGTDEGDTIDAGDGDDLIHVSPGSDTVDGGSGFDILSFANSDYLSISSIDDDERIGASFDGTLAYVRIYSIEGIIGTAFGDYMLFGDSHWGDAVSETRDIYLDGADGRDMLQGALGDDVILGGNDSDSIWSSPGSDSTDGGAGIDWLIFDSAFATHGV